MTTILPTDRPILYTVHGVLSGEDVLLSDMTQVGDLTGVCQQLSVVSDADENAYLGALVPLADSFPPLPDSGWLDADDLYAYADGVVRVRQSHQRTEWPPEDTPALFLVYREDAESVLEWVAGEEVAVGTLRAYEGVTYRCLQAHVTQTDWTPPATPALWTVVSDEEPTDEWQPWTAYAIGDVVTYNGVEYECIQAHTSHPGWEPPNVPALWTPT